MQSLVSEDMNTVFKIDNFLKDFWREKTRGSEQNLETIFEELQIKLEALWSTNKVVENSRT